MPSLTFTISAAGPLVDATLLPDSVGYRQLTGNCSSTVQPIKLTLLIDTGTAKTLVEESLLPGPWHVLRRGPGLVASGAGGGQIATIEYDFDFAMLGKFPAQGRIALPSMTVYAGKGVKTSSYDGLLGRDLLGRIDRLDYCGRLGQFSVHS